MHMLAFLNGTTSPILDTTVIVNTSFIPPIPFISSPLNHTTYNTKQVPLTYTINSKVLWSYYSLDTYHESFNGNITLPALSAGSHKLRLYVTTESYNLTTFKESIQTIYFSIDSNQIIQVTPVPSQSTPTPSQTSSPTPTTPYLPPNDRNAPHLEPTFYLLPISVIIAMIVIAIVIYRKRKIGT